MQDDPHRSTSKSLPWRVEEAFAAEVELERARWQAITAFVELLTAWTSLTPTPRSAPIRSGPSAARS